ncbi:unnamed protein product [Rotaria sp. Silwood2]|nr:unnamed protein product [Rotaria sp. Silwood2]CAF3927722.1 unnamed protein product [Rotaria sp. Silwood2]
MYVLFIFIFLFTLPTIESSRCSKECKFKDFQLNSSFPSDFCSISKSNNDINQRCRVELTIDFTTGLVNGSFNTENQSSLVSNKLDIRSIFSLNDISVKVTIRYYCSVSDYCDLDFVRETLSSNWSTVEVQSIREKLASHLYDPNNIDPIKCFSNDSCPQNESLCFVSYVYWEWNKDLTVSGTCRDSISTPRLLWSQSYEGGGIWRSLTEIGLYYCNTPTCGYNTSAIEIFQRLSREYILPLNLSLINTTTTTPKPTETTSSAITSTIRVTTASNHATSLFGHFFNTIIIFFAITKYFLIN